MSDLLSGLWRSRASLASGATIAVAAVTISTLAVMHEGVPTADLELDDGGVWVTRTADSLVGHLNFPSRQLDGAVVWRGGEYDILQDGDHVLVDAAGVGLASVVDPALLTTTDVAIPAGARLALGGETVAVADATSVWLSVAESFAGAVFTEDSAVPDVGGADDVAVSKSGERVFLVSAARGELLTVDPEADAPVVAVTPLQGVGADAVLTVTAVGERPVVFDSVSGTVYLPDGTTAELPSAEGGVLQQTSDESDGVYVATPGSLLRQPLGGGDADIVHEASAGRVTAPVALGGCAYAVWSGTGEFFRDCPGDADDQQVQLDVPEAATLALRTNRRVVVVNDVSAGSVWLASGDLTKVDNWDDVVPPSEDDGDEDESEQEEQTFQLPERSEQNTDPVAEDDRFGVRTGRATVVKVTDNDSDADGDLLSASLVGEAPPGFTVEPVLSGAALQVTVPDTGSGTVSFRYRVDDGRGGTDDATVTLTVRDATENDPPVQDKVNTVQVEAGASITYPALDGWSDPDGDDLLLTGATVEGGDSVTYRANGVIEFTSLTEEPGLQTIELTVSDTTEETTGALRVDVRPAGTLDPVANADRVTATAGIPVIVSPLANDISPTGEPLRLTDLDWPADVAATPDYAGGTFAFTAPSAGVYYVQYMATVGAHSTPGLIRIDVVAGDGGDIVPIAARDVAYLPTGRQTLVDVLANDSDPAGGILVVQSAAVPAGAGVSVEVLDHTVLRISDLGGLSRPTVITYSVSNGPQSARGEVMVMPVPLPDTLRPPVAVDDDAAVRVGDVVTIAVLENDYHPDGDVLSLAPDMLEPDLAGLGTMFVDGDRLRFQAGAEPGTAYATYAIADSQLQSDSAYVTINVLPADEGSNSAPRPKPVTARVIAGNTVRIAIPLDGIDPDGDSVELVGLSATPSLGDVEVGSGWLSYTAHAGGFGSDTFTYVVRDRLGSEAESAITVGVAAPGFDNQAPYAVKDAVTVRPGRKVAVAVTANDTDPDGDEILIDPDGLGVPDGLDAEIIGGRVVVTAPDQRDEYTLTYTIADAFGATAQGPLVVTVDPEAPLKVPVARDDWISPLSVDGDGVADVAVLENDEDPDGTTDALSIDVFDDGAVVRGDVVRVTLADEPRVIRYAVTDEDGGVGQAFIFVPGLASLLPTVTVDGVVEVRGGESVDVALADYVKVRTGREPRISTADSLKTGTAQGTAAIVDEHTISYTAAEDGVGPDTIGVLVTDGTGPDDPEGLENYILIPVTVIPATNQPPTLRNASATLAPGEESVTLNLAKLATDADGDELTFTAGSAPAGISSALSGSELTLSADASVEPGQELELGIEVTDGTSAPVAAKVLIKTVISQRPLPVANDDVVGAVDQGTTARVPVLDNDFNPFDDRGALRLISARVDSGTGIVVVDGDRVAVTPASDFFGTMIVTYRIGDVTERVEREVEGRITLTVQGRPDAPGVPSVTSVQDRTVVLNWTPPANNGAPITGYTVSSVAGNYTKQCALTTCTLDGLTNNVEYRFTVVATNSVGDSDPSQPSAVARPDTRPDRPAPPTLQFGDKSLTVSWTKPVSHGSPVKSYTLEISPAPASGPLQRTGVTGTSLVWDGLENGVAYQVRVQAVNDAPDPSAWSPYSGTMIPAGIPDAPGTPTTSPATPVGSQAQIAVSWAAPANDNGDAVADYTLTVKRGGSVVNTLTVAGTSQNVVVDTSQTDYTFSVTARNKAGSSPSSGDSSPRRGAVAPDAPTAVALSPGDRSVGVTITPGALNGSRSNEITYHYRVNQTGATGTIPVSGGTVSGLSNGTSYTLNVWATSSVQGVSPSGETTSNAAVPFGKPIITLQGIDRLDNAVRFRFNVNANGRPLTASSPTAPDGSGNVSYTRTGLTAGQSYTLNASYTNAAGTSTASWTGAANDPPPPTVTIRKGTGVTGTGTGTGGNGCSVGNTCYKIWVDAVNFGANATYTAGCYADGSSSAYYTQNVTTNGNGAFSGDLNCFSGYNNTRASVNGVFSNYFDFR